MNTNKIIRHTLVEKVRVRKYPVNIPLLQQTLRSHKTNERLTNKEIAEALSVPVTMVEHWFRTDKSFSIPGEDVWPNLKKLLNIEFDDLDESIMTFEEKDNIFDKSNRVYDSNGIAPTLTVASTEHEKFIVYEDNSKMEDDILYKNTLEKFKFNMDEIKLFDAYAGIGSLHQSLKELGVPVKLTGISEIDVDAIISYAAIHIEGFKDMPFEYPSDDIMKKYLMDRNIGYNFDKQKSSIPRMKKDKLKLCYKASILTNCMGDVSSLDFDKIPDSDLFNFSFPCTSVSGAGKQEGMTKADGSITHSGLYIYGIKAIKAKRFKYIMIENVEGLIQKKFVNDFYNIIKEIEDLGYNCYYPKKDNGNPTCLNAKQYGIPQSRKRIFVICIRKDVDKGEFSFPEGFDNGVRLKDILETNVDEKYYIDNDKAKTLMLQLKDKESLLLDMCQSKREGKPREYTDFSPTLSARDYKEPRLINTIGQISNEGSQTGKVYDTNGIFPTICAGTHGYAMGNILDNSNELKEVGKLDIKGHDCIKRVYSPEGISPTITTMGGGNREPKILAMRGRYNEDGEIEQQLEARKDDVTNTITTAQKDNLVLESNITNYESAILRPVRTEYGKEIRKQYEAGEIKESRHNMTILEPRFNGISNTITTVQKDNLLLESKSPNPEPIVCEQRTDEGLRFFKDNVCGTLRTIDACGDKRIIEQNPFRIRKLTPTEAWILMGFRKEHVERVKELGISDSALYKMAGNSIVVNCLYYIFKEVFREYIED